MLLAVIPGPDTGMTEENCVFACQKPKGGPGIATVGAYICQSGEQAAMARARRRLNRSVNRRRRSYRAWSPLRETALVLGLLLLLGLKLGFDGLTESASFELLWLAGEVGYHLAAAEEVLGYLIP